jgi:hypothetical protein
MKSDPKRRHRFILPAHSKKFRAPVSETSLVAVPATSGCLDPHAIAFVQAPASFRGNCFFFTLATNNLIASSDSRFSAMQTVRGALSSIGK